MTIRAVVFDCGNVLELTGDDHDLDAWAAIAKVPADEVARRLDGVFDGAEVGAVTLDEVHARLGDALGIGAGQVGELMELFWRVYLGTPNTGLVQWARQLRPRYKTGILSNSGVGAREREQAAYGYEDWMDVLVYSHEVGMMKPDPRIYALCCERLGVLPAQAVLVDDVAVNVAAARDAGLHAVHFTGDTVDLANQRAIAEISGLLGGLYARAVNLGPALGTAGGTGYMTTEGERGLVSGRAGGTARPLGDGTSIPLLGLGVWQVPDGPQTVNAVRWALELGYRHIDTAQAYRNEQSVGRALRESGIPRDQVYITTKFLPNAKDPVAELEHSLGRLGVDQVDLYLVHWPRGGPLRAWPGMEKALGRGLTRSIGVSNFSAAELDQVIRSASVPPVVDQVQFSAMEYRRGLLDAAEKQGVVLEAYSPLGTGRHLADPRVAAIAGRAGRTPAQVLIRWCLQHGLPVIPKSTRRERIAENAAVLGFTLADEDMAALDALDQTGGTDRARESHWW